ncbi:hypothetical protein HD554DRAFT_2313291 [Boletus coccyginus]|nr:hypothetical protein HD554DRAFT_2313291 [Boletus coccyginus]
MQGPKLETTPCTLNPVTSLNPSRYRNSGCAPLCPRVITGGPVSRSRTSSTTNWKRAVHPEGQPYFVLSDEFAFVVVTEANIEDAQTQRRILECIEAANGGLSSHDIKPPPRCELFLELTADHAVCNYYFADHIGKVLFWLDDLCTELLDIPATASDSHLETELERLYWVHVEFFPMHHVHEQQFLPLVDDICNIISHGQADRLTSSTSTFPYTADRCRDFLETLSRKRGQHMDGYTLCYAARLAGAIGHHRFITYYGQPHAQLDRLQEMFPADVIQHRWLVTVANLPMWGVPLHYLNLLDDLYTNEQVYAEQWTHFMSICLADWTSSLSWSFPVFIGSILLANVRGGTISASIPSVFSCAVSIASASCLHLRHQPLVESSASVGARYLHFARSSTIGFLPSSVAFSLPRAGYLWGVGFLIAQFFFVASQSVSKLAALVAASGIFAILMFVLSVIHPEGASISSLFQSFTSFCIPLLLWEEVLVVWSLVMGHVQPLPVLDL